METTDQLYETKKFGQRCRGVRWGVKSSSTVRRNYQLYREGVKREHSVFVVMNRDEEEAANAHGAAAYREMDDYSSVSNRIRMHPVTDNESRNPNPNHKGASSVVHYSVDKKKNWETIEAAKKAQQRRMALTRSYSDTDELEDSTSDDSSNDDDDELRGIPKVAVVERQTVIDDSIKRTDFGNLKLANAFVSKSTKNYALDKQDSAQDDEERERAAAQRYVVSKGRKGRMVREKREKGKKGVKKPQMANHQSRFIQDLANADTLIAVATPIDHHHHLNHGEYVPFTCCKLCNPPKANAHQRDHGAFRKLLLDGL